LIHIIFDAQGDLKMSVIANAKMTRSLGRSGIEVSALGLGCWAIGGLINEGAGSGWHGVNDEESIRAIQRGLDLGINFLDTANVYGHGHSERVIAKAIEGRRDEVILATKFTWTFDEETLEGTGADVTPAGIRHSCEGSLRRLNTDYIDLLQFHHNDFPAEEAGEVRETLEALVAEGKIRTYGWSTDFPDRARFFAEGPNCSTIQVEMNVVDDAPDIIAVCEEFNLAAINRGPLAMGLLTGKYAVDTNMPGEDVRGLNAPDWMKYFKDGKPNPEWMQLVDAVREILTSEGRSLAQGALGWLWARSEKTIPIPGFKTVAQVEQNAGAMAFGPLKPAQMQEIDALLGRS
jgi:aryl-alcohol dehydrogenase-like predicted oxidoreductase